MVQEKEPSCEGCDEWGINCDLCSAVVAIMRKETNLEEKEDDMERKSKSA